MGNPLNENSSRRGFGVTLALLRRSLTVGVILFVLPPTGEFPYRWQAAVAFLVLTAWCYVCQSASNFDPRSASNLDPR